MVATDGLAAGFSVEVAVGSFFGSPTDKPLPALPAGGNDNPVPPCEVSGTSVIVVETNPPVIALTELGFNEASKIGDVLAGAVCGINTG
jgi:hypothetical protein